jgi:hypothetical protein
MEHLVRIPGPIARQIRIEYQRKTVIIQHGLQTIERTHDSSTALWECLYTFYPIAEFLSPIEVIGLTFLNKQFKLDKRMKEWYLLLFKTNIVRLMEAKGHPLLAGILYTIPQPWPFVLSGSVVLQALLSETWDSYDIDIYGKEQGLSELENLLRENWYVSHYNPDTDDRYIQLEATKSIKEVMDWYNLVRTVNNKFFVRACVLQIIELSDHIERASDCVKAFDLSIVKNSWNGKTIYIHDYKALLSKTTNVSDNIELIVGAMGNGRGSFAGAFERIHSLQNNAILSINLERMNIEFSHAAIVSFFDKIFSRFKKYAKRGFIIQTNKRILEISDINTILDRLRKSPTTKKRWALLNQIKKLKQR